MRAPLASALSEVSTLPPSSFFCVDSVWGPLAFSRGSPVRHDVPAPLVLRFSDNCNIFTPSAPRAITVLEGRVSGNKHTQHRHEDGLYRKAFLASPCRLEPLPARATPLRVVRVLNQGSSRGDGASHTVVTRFHTCVHEYPVSGESVPIL